MRLGQPVMKGGGNDTTEQTEESRVSSRASPEHAEQERGKEGRVNKSKDELEQVHDVVEVGRKVGGGDTDTDPDDSRGATHPQQRGIVRLRPEISLVNIIGPNRVERGDIAGHSRHERSHQRSEPEAENSRWKIMSEH